MGHLSNAVSRFRPLLDFIAEHEGTAREPVSGYNTSLGYGRYLPGGQEHILVEKNLFEINELQEYMLDNEENPHNSSAIGRYQIVRRTLLELRFDFGLSGWEKYSPELQDELATVLIRRRGRSVSGLRAEWASLSGVDADDILSAYDQSRTGRTLIDLVTEYPLISGSIAGAAIGAAFSAFRGRRLD